MMFIQEKYGSTPAVMLLAIFLSACSSSPEYHRPALALPDYWGTPYQMSTSDPLANDHYQDSELHRLIQKALTNNQDLQAALQRVHQARAASTIAGATLWPSVDLTLEKSSDYGDKPKLQNSNYRAGINVAYEVDLWGRYRGIEAAAVASLQASQFDYSALSLMVSADTAQAYASLLALQRRLQLANNNINNAREMLVLVQARDQEGAASGFELAQQQAVLANLEAATAELVQQRDAAQNQLAILLGQAPQLFKVQENDFANLSIPQTALAKPVELLYRRPDILRAEANLKAAHINVEVARAALFPNLQLSVQKLLTANTLSGPSDNLISAAAALSAPIFQGGALRAEVVLNEAKREELVALYRQTVLQACREVADAVTAMQVAQQRYAALSRAEQASSQAYAIANERYRAGATDFQDLLDTQRQLFLAEDATVRSQLEQVAAAIDLFRAQAGWLSGDADILDKHPRKTL